MIVEQVMSRNIVSIGSDSPVIQAAMLMKEHNIGALPVLKDEKVVGMVTDRDIAVRAVAAGTDLAKAKIDQVMTPNVVWCWSDTSVEDAANLMKEKQVRRLIAANRDNRPVGVVSVDDLASCIEENKLAGAILSSLRSGS